MDPQIQPVTPAAPPEDKTFGYRDKPVPPNYIEGDMTTQAPSDDIMLLVLTAERGAIWMEGGEAFTAAQEAVMNSIPAANNMFKHPQAAAVCFLLWSHSFLQGGGRMAFPDPKRVKLVKV